MKRIVIAGTDSYIGTHIADHLLSMPEKYAVVQLDMRNGVDEQAFENCDAVVHVAGIAHQRETAQNALLYQQVNCELALETARAAKAQGVRQFVFFSSMSVYGLTTGRITAQTQPNPTTYYGRSKWEAEKQLSALADGQFQVAVLRPPMIYGKGCRGNYPRLSALAQELPVFPLVANERSMLHIDALCLFVQSLLETGKGGLYFPQNSSYVSTCELVREVCRCHDKRIWMIPGLGWLLRLLAVRVGVVGKVFGTLTYDLSMSEPFLNVQDFAETIRRTEEEP